MTSPAKEKQRRYLDCFSSEELEAGFHKPWSCSDAGGYLADMGAMLSILPPPPGRLLDLGCGMGWTSVMFARRGYDVLGIDLAENMIAMAERKRAEERIPNVAFAACDFEGDPNRFGQFDCAVFYDSLHHSDDERRALAAVYRALRPGGVCITLEPGVGHSASEEAILAVQRTGVNERDMEPARIIAAARDAGFTSWRIYPHPRAVHGQMYSHRSLLQQLAWLIQARRRRQALSAVVLLTR